MRKLSAALLASTALALQPASAASITARADSKTATIGNSGFGIYSFGGVPGLACSTAAARHLAPCRSRRSRRPGRCRWLAVR